MQKNFDTVIEKVFQHEGGYGNHPRDPGGPTNWGITQAVYGEYIGRAASIDEVKAITKPIAKAIYKKNYWDKLNCDNLPNGVDYTVMDFGVNSGVSRSAKRTQKLVGVKQDGVIGNDTLQAVRNYVATYGVPKFINEFNDGRLAWLKGLKTWPTFGRGWERRVVEVKRDSLVLAAGSTLVSVPVAPSPTRNPEPIAYQPSSAPTATAIAVTGVATVSLASGGAWIWLVIGAAIIAGILFRKRIAKLFTRKGN